VNPVQPCRASSRPWTTRELAELREHAHLGAAAAAEKLGRSVASVKAAAHRHVITLRRPGCRCGSILGQPRGMALSAAIRAGVASGRVDAALMLARVTLDREAPLCPSCGRRPQRVDSTGLCLVCHREALVAKHLEALEELDALRAMWSTRQALKRERDRSATGS